MILYLDTSNLPKLYLEEPGIHLASCAELTQNGERVEFLAHDVRLMRAASKELRKQRQS